MKTKLSILLLALFAFGCATSTPAKKASDLMFAAGQGVNSAYAAYLDGIFQGTIKTNDFRKVTTEYQNFQQIFSLAVSELPGTNGVAGVLVQGAAVTAAISAAQKGK